MKRILIGGVAIASMLIATGAFAADLAARTYTKAPVMVDPGYNWTGFYAGLNGGYSWGKANTTLFAGTVLATAVGQDVKGGLFGGQIGYNWQINPKWVLGLEADGQWTGERGRRSDPFASIRTPTPGNDFNIVTTMALNTEFSLPWFATFRGRAGILVDPSLLLYGTGGLAVGEVKVLTQLSATAQLFGPGVAGTIPSGAPVTVLGPASSESQTRVGWTAGAGLEKKFSQNWSAKLEYLYLDLGTKTYFGGTANAIDVSFHDHILRAGINYAFGPGPLVGKY